MKTYCYVEPDIDGISPIKQCLTEEEILDRYWEYWSKKGFERGEYTPLITFESCIDDWVVINWAYIDPIK